MKRNVVYEADFKIMSFRDYIPRHVEFNNKFSFSFWSAEGVTAWWRVRLIRQEAFLICLSTHLSTLHHSHSSLDFSNISNWMSFV